MESQPCNSDCAGRKHLHGKEAVPVHCSRLIQSQNNKQSSDALTFPSNDAEPDVDEIPGHCGSLETIR